MFTGQAHSILAPISELHCRWPTLRRCLGPNLGHEHNRKSVRIQQCDAVAAPVWVRRFDRLRGRTIVGRCERARIAEIEDEQ